MQDKFPKGQITDSKIFPFYERYNVYLSEQIYHEKHLVYTEEVARLMVELNDYKVYQKMIPESKIVQTFQ